MQIINDMGSGGRIGEALGSGLQQLANYKLQELTSQYEQQRKSNDLRALEQLYAKSGYESEAPLLAELTQRDPKNIFKVLELLGGGQMGDEQNALQMLGQQGVQPAQADLAQLQQAGGQQIPQAAAQAQQPGMTVNNIQKPNFRQSVGRGIKQKKELSVAEQKHMDSLEAQKLNLEDMITTTDRMMKSLEEGINVGFIPTIKAATLPTLLDEPTEQYDKDAAHVINLTSQNIKGVPSKFRVQLIEKEKPGVKHSITVNKQIVERLNKDARKAYEALNKRYPTLGEKLESSGLFEDVADFPPASQHSGETIYDDATGEPKFKSNGQQWVPVGA